MIDRTRRDLSPEDIARVANTYHAWRNQTSSGSTPSPSMGEGRGEGDQTPSPSQGEGRGGGPPVSEGESAPYTDSPGFCKSATIEEIRKHGHVLTPGRYVGAAPQEDDGEPFEEKMTRLTKQWREQQAEARRLDAAIEENLVRLGFGTGKGSSAEG